MKRELSGLLPTTILVACMGCAPIDQSSSASQGTTQTEENTKSLDPRNQLLMQLQGQDEATKLQTLLEIIETEHEPAVRRDALRFTAGLGEKAAPLADSLAHLFVVEKDLHIANDLKQVLVACRTNVESALLAADADASPQQRMRIVEGLAATGASSSQTLAYLDEQMRSNDTELVIAACAAAEQLGPAAQPLLPTLIELADRPRIPPGTDRTSSQAFRASRDTTGAAVRAIAAVGPDKSALAVLIACLEMEPSIAEAAANALTKLGPNASLATPALEKLHARNDHGGKDIKTRLAREAAATALIAIAPKPN